MGSRGMIVLASLLALAGCDEAETQEQPQAPEQGFQQPRPIEPPGPPPEAPSFDPAQVALGAEIYIDFCAACHGENLEGAENWRERNPDGSLPAPPHDKTGHTWHHSDRVLFDYTKLGGAEMIGDLEGFVSAMPGFGEDLTDDEIWAVLTYIKSTWPAEVQMMQAKMTAAEGE